MSADKSATPDDSAGPGKNKVKPAKETKTPKEKKVAEKKAPKEKSSKKGGFPWVFALVPVALVAAFVLAFTLPPTHAMLMKSPLRPLLSRFDHSPTKSVAAAAKSEDSPGEVKRLNDTLEIDRKAAAQKDVQIAQLQSQLKSQAAAPASASPPGAKPAPAAPVPTDEMKRAATYWAGMDADKAAEIIKQLPDSYVKTVFTAMPPDAVAEIMSALPAKTAARLTTNAGSNSP